MHAIRETKPAKKIVMRKQTNWHGCASRNGKETIQKMVARIIRLPKCILFRFAEVDVLLLLLR